MTRVLRAGGFWRRAVALAVDWIWLFALAGSLSIVLFGVALPGAASGAAATGARALHFGLPALVLVGGWWLCGTTPGKYLLDLRVVDHRSGGRPPLWRGLLRLFGYAVAAAPFGLGFVLAVANRDRRALHDYLAGTRVVVIEETDVDLTLGAPTA